MKDICRDMWKKIKEVVDGPEENRITHDPIYGRQGEWTWYKNGKYIPNPPKGYFDYTELYNQMHENPENNEVQAQGMWDTYKFLSNKEFMDKIQKIVDSVDVDDDGWLNIKLNLKIKKESE